MSATPTSCEPRCEGAVFLRTFARTIAAAGGGGGPPLTVAIVPGTADHPSGAMGRYRVLEEIALADCALAIEGDDLDDLFATAAAALAEMMVDPATLPITVEHTVRLSAPAIDLLLYDWLSELIFRKDRDREVFTRTEVQVSPSSPCQLTARLYGGVIDPEQTALGIDLKAVTFHAFALEAANGAWRARVVIDV